MQKEFYTRNLPHIQPEDGMFFITFRLAGTLPKEVVKELVAQQKALQLALDRDIHGPTKLPNAGSLFEKYEHLMDNPKSGPLWLSDYKIATVVTRAILYNDNVYYKAVCYSIMANHVHLIIYKCTKPLYRILQSIKRHTAREANIILGRNGAFWHKESYDNVIRDMNEFVIKINYVLQNPVKAGVVSNWQEHPHTWIRPGFTKYIMSTSDF